MSTNEEAQRVEAQKEIDNSVGAWREKIAELLAAKEDGGGEAAQVVNEMQKPPVAQQIEMEQTGLVRVKFSERMQIISDLSMITNGTVSIGGKKVPVFDIEVIPADDQDPDVLKFDWSVVEMTEHEL